MVYLTLGQVAPMIDIALKLLGIVAFGMLGYAMLMAVRGPKAEA